MLKNLFLSTLLALPVWTLAAAPLFEHGATTWQIVISPKASSAEAWGARELSSYLEKISGAAFPIVKTAEIPSAGGLVIGTAASFPELKELAPAVPADEQDSLRVIARTGNLYLLGNNPRSALYAVYSFLEKVFGVRWLFMGEAGEVVPRKDAMTLPPELDIRETSRFRYRGFHVCGTFYHDEMELWMARNKLNMIRSNPANGKKWVADWNRKRIARGFHMMFSNHNIAIYDRQVFESRPELFAVVNGKPIPDQLCWSNPEVDKIMIGRFVKAIGEFPEVEIISMFPADNMNYCRCPECSKFSKSDLWFRMLQRLGRGIREVYPGKKIASIAYQSYLEAPQTPLDGMDLMEYCMYDRCYVHKFGECEINQKVLKRLHDWKKKGVPLSVYGYEFDIFSIPMAVPFGKMLEDQLKVMDELGLCGAIPEALAPDYKGRNASPSGRLSGEHHLHEYYLYARLLWDRNGSFDTVSDDYAAHAFGPAGKVMAAYYRLLAEAWSGMKIHYSYFFNSHLGCSEHFLNPKLIARGEALLKEAEKAVRTVADPARRKQLTANLDREKALFAGWLKTYRDYMASSQNSKILLPRAAAPRDFTGAAELPAFRTRSAAAPVKTEVKMNYDDDNLYFDVTCHDRNIRNLAAKLTERDSALWTDETIEIFIAVPDDTEGIYRHFIVNPRGARYDAVALGGMTFNTAWNPDWEAGVAIGKDAWHAVITIPFAALGRRPVKNEVWSFTINRNNGGARTDIPNSGFPDATVHDPNAFGSMQFCNISESRPTFFFSRHPEVDVREMKMLMENAGYQTVTARSEKEIPAELPAQKVYVIRWTRGVKLPDAFCRKLRKALDDGALVMFMCWGELELEKYFRDQTFQLKWSGWKIDPKRKSCNVKPGSWQTSPDNMSDLVNKGLTPANGYKPVFPDHWQNLGELKMLDGSLYSFLLTRQVGKGLLVVCSGDYGMSGGAAMFGSRKPQSIMLLNNMYQMMLDAR